MTRAGRSFAAVLGSAVLLVAGCSSSATKKPALPAVTASSSPAAPPPKNPYTGIGATPNSPTIAVKIDDTPPGRPQRGVDLADIVYIEAAEGGLTRLAAVFGTNKPVVGYVRSTRPSDPELLLQFGKITEAYSGGAHDSLPLLNQSGITSWSNDAGAPFYSRESRAASSYINLVLDLGKVAKATKTPPPHDIGWVFSPTISGVQTVPGTDVRTAVTGSYNNGTPVEFRWDAKLSKYVRYIDGERQMTADGRPIATSNVIVQECRIEAHPEDTDVNGNPSQYTTTVGTGAVSVFRNGKWIKGSWSRPNANSGTKLLTKDGKPLPLSPGNTWVVLVRTGTALQG